LVTRPDGELVQSQLLPLSDGSKVIWPASKDAKEDKNKPSAELALLVSVPPLGHVVYKVVRRAEGGAGDSAQQGGKQQPTAPTALITLAVNSSMQLTNGKLQITVGPTGISSVSVAGGSSISYSSTLISYKGNFHGSGAYTFTAGGEPSLPAPSAVEVVQGPVLQEVRQQFRDLPGMLTTRPWAGKSHLEVEWTIKPPSGGRSNWEAFVRYTSNIKSDSLWFTDANGREYQQRRRDYRPSFKFPAGSSAHRLPANIYPITTGCFLQDAHYSMNIAVDRAQGAVSMADGQLDINVHRTSAGDDGKGMSEPLIDQHVAAGVHIVSLQQPNGSTTVTDSSTRRHYEQVTSRTACCIPQMRLSVTVELRLQFSWKFCHP
jgi:hypothetical protein